MGMMGWNVLATGAGGMFLVVVLLSEEMVGNLNPAKRPGFEGDAVDAAVGVARMPKRLNGLPIVGVRVFGEARRGRESLLPRNPASRDLVSPGVFAATTGVLVGVSAARRAIDTRSAYNAAWR